jgi:hypothetical protein
VDHGDDAGHAADGSAVATDASVERPEHRERDFDSARAAAWVFAIYVAAALPILLWIGSYRWFLGDEWAFIADRGVNFHDLFRDHNQHWSTVPLLSYRALYSLFGLNAYWPYQLVVIVLHLTTAVLIRVVMRRSGVRPWIATIAAGSFVLLGPAEDNILWAFQVGFVGSLVFGFVQLILADHDGPIDRRDWLGLGAGLLCLMSSGQSVSLIAATGLMCLFRRRWAAAAFHTLPLALAYITWLVLTEVSAVLEVDEQPFTVGRYFEWMKDAVAALFTALGHFDVLAVALVGLLVIGGVVGARSEGAAPFVRRAAPAVALLVGAVISMSSAAPSRFSLGGPGATAGRYVGVMAAMVLPALAVSADAVSKRFRWATPVVVLLFLVPVPPNIVTFGDNEILSPAGFRGIREYTAALADHPLTSQVPPWVEPNQSLLGVPGMKVGWLLAADRRGEIPDPTQPLHPLTAGLIPIQLGVAGVENGSADGLVCTDHRGTLPVDPQVGDRWYFATPVQVAGRVDDRPVTQWAPYTPTEIEITLPDLHLLLAPVAPETTFRWCR